MQARKETQGLFALAILTAVFAYAFYVVGPWDTGVQGCASCLLLSLIVLSAFAVVRGQQSTFEDRRTWLYFVLGALFLAAAEASWVLALFKAPGSEWLPHVGTLLAYVLFVIALARACKYLPRPRTSNAKRTASILAAALALAALYALLAKGAVPLDYAYALAEVALAGWALYALALNVESGAEIQPYRRLGAGFALLAVHGLIVIFTQPTSAYHSVAYPLDGLYLLAFVLLAWGAEKEVKLLAEE